VGEERSPTSAFLEEVLPVSNLSVGAFSLGTLGAQSPPSGIFGTPSRLGNLDILRILRLRRLRGSLESALGMRRSTVRIRSPAPYFLRRAQRPNRASLCGRRDQYKRLRSGTDNPSPLDCE
jgi:hypothetical protein